MAYSVTRRPRNSAALIATVAAALFCAAVGQAGAQGYPTRNISLIVPFPPGGGVDTVGRIIRKSLPTLSASK